uniref:Fork-head domain-containing protein n=1 Tax=Monopterus albus TaxID=43700 RepID=A0A3Q3IGT7_MONAL
MNFQLKTKACLFDLHCSVGLTDWEMDKELKLATTTDQFYHDDQQNDQYVVQRPSARASRRKDEFIWYDKTSDTFVKPNLWLLVNPNIACPMQYGENTADLQILGESREIQTSLLEPVETQHSLGASLQDKLLHPASSCSEYLDSKTLKPGCWPRPPVNYCILIALALKSSHTGSLKVQQIYSFTREHFPFFQTAPEGWKNTIRHNLCFNSSFRKTCNQLNKDGKRKSCFWYLTTDGQRRLEDEIHTLTRESFKQLERSMSCPGQTWKWSTGSSNYSNWAPGEPRSSGDCGAISSVSKKMTAQNCSDRFPFVCYRDNLVLVKENKTWEEALAHCRALGSFPDTRSYELVSVQPGDDHMVMVNKVQVADTNEVWAGLRFLAGHWFWVNGADLLYSDLPFCPPNGQHCGALSKTGIHSLDTRDCLEKRNFLCYSTPY